MFGSSYTGGMSTYRSATQINSAMGRVYGHMALAVSDGIFLYRCYEMVGNFCTVGGNPRRQLCYGENE